MWRKVLISCVVFAGAAVAQAPDTSLRPVARPGTYAQPEALRRTPSIEGIGVQTSLRPQNRPAEVSDEPLREAGRKTRRERRAEKRALAKGAVCGDLDIQGVQVGRVPGKIRGCGLDNAVRISAISGVSLSQKSVMDCGTARALKSWIDKGMKPAVSRKGGGVVRLKVAAHYACRTRNNRKGAKISEHGKGRAIDISAFQLRDGTNISVLKDWNKGRNGRILKKMHGAACGPFGTVLGPNADRHHRDHFHFDTARHRNGQYCR